MDVVAVDDFKSGAANVPFLGDARIITADTLNTTMLRALFEKHRVDVVYHLTDQPGDRTGEAPAASVYLPNLVGTANVVDEARRAGVPRFLLLSSTAVYGAAAGASSEVSPTMPVDPFGAPASLYVKGYDDKTDLFGAPASVSPYNERI